MRIVGGDRRGLKLDPPKDQRIRPTSDRVREALFNILAHDPDWIGVAGIKVLDVFAGTGALGLEAFSRGAAQVTFIENAPDSLTVLQGNIRRARAEGATQIRQLDATRPGRARDRFDLVLMDPPYGTDLGNTALRALQAQGWLADKALIVVESDGKAGFEAPEGFRQLDQRSYGRTRLTFLGVGAH